MMASHCTLNGAIWWSKMKGMDSCLPCKIISYMSLAYTRMYSVFKCKINWTFGFNDIFQVNYIKQQILCIKWTVPIAALEVPHQFPLSYRSSRHQGSHLAVCGRGQGQSWRPCSVYKLQQGDSKHTLTGLLSQQSEPQLTAKMNAKLAVCSVIMESSSVVVGIAYVLVCFLHKISFTQDLDAHSVFSKLIVLSSLDH